ncbi:MAG: dephospho-CoA kinase, partial [Burkholderiaceae bacterium]
MTAGHESPARFSVGLTGGIGSGKSTVADLFGRLGAAIVDTDLISHDLTAPGGRAMPVIRREFGDAFIAPDGALDRAAMRAAVFADAGARRRLESILHPLIRAETARVAGLAHGAYLMFVVPLLVESGTWKARVSRVLVVDCDEEEQVRRVMRRSGLTREQALAILAAPATRGARRGAAAAVIGNHGGIDARAPRGGRPHAGDLAGAAVGPT